MLVLGISAFYHDSAAAIVKDGRILAAAHEERFSRRKHDSEFPASAVAYCLDSANAGLEDVDFVGFYDKPLLTFDRLLETYLSFAPAGISAFVEAIPVWVKKKLLLRSVLANALKELGHGEPDDDRLMFGFHHQSHAASAFYPSPFDSAAILVMDGVGEWATTSMGVGRGTDIELSQEIRYPHSLGLLYSAFTAHLGFKVNDGEYKVMGLAPYGEAKYVKTIYDNMIDVKEDGSYRLNMDVFNYCTGLTMTNRRFSDLLGKPPRNPGMPLTQHEMDVARSIQVVVEDIVLRLCETARRQTGEENLCLAGGVALNCVANGRVLREGPFERIWIQPAAGDAGGAIGVALEISHRLGKIPRLRAGDDDSMEGAFLGPAFDDPAITAILDGFGAVYETLDDNALFETTAEALASEKVVGWFQGRMEFGPRSLGNRSILGDPRSPRMQRVLNLKIKYRESFRPFAPAVLADDVIDYFEFDGSSPYMLLVADVRPERLRDLSEEDRFREGFEKLDVVRSDIPAVTHVDNSARIQTVHQATNPRFHRLIETFKARTGCGVLVNTSFNTRDEPIVCTPEDAYRCFMGTEMDMLVLGNAVLRKDKQ